MEATKRALAKFVRSYREKEDLTQIELGERLGVSGPTIWRWENEIDMPRDEHLHALAEETGEDPFLIVGARAQQESRELMRRAGRVRARRAAEAGEEIELWGFRLELMPDGSLLVNDRVRVQPEEEG